MAGIVNIFDQGIDSDPTSTTDHFTLDLGPAEIQIIPKVSGVLYDDRTEATMVTPDGRVIYDVNKGHYPGQTKLREVAALRANSNDVSTMWAEFGVELGRSAFFLSHYLPAQGEFFLFDSFEGLPEDWALSPTNTRPGEAWACDIQKFEDPRMIVVPGWFEDSLPHEAMAGPLALLHIDCDLYSSTKTVLEQLDEQIVPRTVILFDEFWGYPNWRDGEYKALMEWDREFTYLARDTKYRVLIEVL